MGILLAEGTFSIALNAGAYDAKLKVAGKSYDIPGVVVDMMLSAMQWKLTDSRARREAEQKEEAKKRHTSQIMMKKVSDAIMYSVGQNELIHGDKAKPISAKTLYKRLHSRKNSHLAVSTARLTTVAYACRKLVKEGKLVMTGAGKSCAYKSKKP